MRRNRNLAPPGEPTFFFVISRMLLGGCVVLLAVAAAVAQQPAVGTTLPKQESSATVLQQPSGNQEGFRLRVETDLVVLHVTVTDKDSKPVADLQQEHFRVFENSVEQRLKVFKREDLPVSVGIIVDNSGSMRDKRKGVNAAALKFVRGSNADDEVFIVNFNDEAFLDADFTDNIRLLEEGLEKIDARGGTALYDGLDLSLKHLSEKGTHDKKVLLVVTDGEDNASRLTLEQLVKTVQRSNAMIYTVGLLGGENSGSIRRAKRALEAISEASGGAAYFPKSLDEVQAIATEIANDIRNQYVLAYTPTKSVLDGSFRKVEVRVAAPKKYGKLLVRTRTGYYAEPTVVNRTQSSGLAVP